MLTLRYENESKQSILFCNEAPYFFLSQQGCDGADAKALLAKAPFQKGKTWLGVNIDQRVVTVKCCLVTESIAETEKRRLELLRVLTPLERGKLIIYGETFVRQFSDVQLVEAPVFNDKDYNSPDGILFFSFSAVVPGNFIEDVQNSQFTLMEVDAEFSFTLEFADDIIFGNMSQGRALFTNDGDIAAPIIVEIYGPVMTPMITNETTGEYIRVQTPILANEKMLINTAFGNKSVIIYDDAGGERNAFHYIDINSTFFHLNVGENAIRFRAEEGNDTAQVTVYYKRQYLGI